MLFAATPPAASAGRCGGYGRRIHVYWDQCCQPSGALRSDVASRSIMGGLLSAGHRHAPPQAIGYAKSLSALRTKGLWSALYAGWYLVAPTRPPAHSTDPIAFIDSVSGYVSSQKLAAGSQIVLWIPDVDPVDSQPRSRATPSCSRAAPTPAPLPPPPIATPSSGSTYADPGRTLDREGMGGAGG